MLDFFKKKRPKDPTIEILKVEDGHIALLRHDLEMRGKDNLDLLDKASKKTQIPIFKGTVEHAYESAFTGYKDKCPRSSAPTQQQYSNFIYATQISSRLMSAPAGHFCTQCATVIIDDDIMLQGIDAKRFDYYGVAGLETGYSEAPILFQTLNGEKVIYVLDEDQGIGGILQSVHMPSDQIFMDPNDYLQMMSGAGMGTRPSELGQGKPRQNKAKKKSKNRQAKQSKKANRKK